MHLDAGTIVQPGMLAPLQRLVERSRGHGPAFGLVRVEQHFARLTAEDVRELPRQVARRRCPLVTDLLLRR